MSLSGALAHVLCPLLPGHGDPGDTLLINSRPRFLTAQTDDKPTAVAPG